MNQEMKRKYSSEDVAEEVCRVQGHKLYGIIGNHIACSACGLTLSEIRCGKKFEPDEVTALTVEQMVATPRFGDKIYADIEMQERH